MPLSRTCRYLCLACLLSYASSSLAQTDSASYNTGVVNSVRFFDSQIRDGGRLFNGIIFKGYDASMQGSPFLDDQDNFSNGSVDYDGQSYQNVPLLYDVYSDQLIAQLDNESIQLVKEKIKSFDLRHRHFIQLKNTKLKNGFYHELYGGRSQVINKIEKQTQAVKSQRIFIPVAEYQQYYILKDGAYLPVNSLNDVLNVFLDKKKELKAFIKSNNIQFNSLKEYSMVQIAQYYDQLKPY